MRHFQPITLTLIRINQIARTINMVTQVLPRLPYTHVLAVFSPQALVFDPTGQRCSVALEVATRCVPVV